MMKKILVVLIICVAVYFAFKFWNAPFVEEKAQECSIQSILDQEWTFSFADSSSLYEFRGDGRFLLEPKNESGQSIEGIWSRDDNGMFVVTGKWGWLNGLSRTNDFREMVIQITLLKQTSACLGKQGPKLYNVHFTIEKLSPITAEMYNERLVASGATELK